MAARSPRRPGATPARRSLAAGVAALALLVVAGCGSDPDAQPTPVSADFSPRLLVDAAATGLDASVAPRGEGDDRVSADPPTTPAGSVIVISTSDPGGDHRIRGELAPLGGAGPTPELDTGVLRPDQEVTVVLADPGTLTLTDDARPGSSVELIVTARPDD